MPIHIRPDFRKTAQIALLLASVSASASEAGANSGWPTDIAVRTETGQQIPVGALGVVFIDAPREATLLQLRGMAGSGDVFLRSVDSRDCLRLAIRLVAGDFGGNTVSEHSAQPIRLIIQSPSVARALARGDDIVSDMYRISSAPSDPDADIIIQTGLSDSHGFVLNPGSSVLDDILGVKTSRTACSEY